MEEKNKYTWKTDNRLFTKYAVQMTLESNYIRIAWLLSEDRQREQYIN